MLFLFVLFPGFHGLRALGQTVRDTSCAQTALAVIPFVSRPQSVEDPVVNSQLTSAVVARLPCARAIKGLEADVLAIMDRNRGSSNAGAAVTELVDLLRARQGQIQQERGNARDRRVHLLAGFAEEIFGFIALTAIHVSPKGLVEKFKVTVRASDLVRLAELLETGMTLDEDDLEARLSRHAELMPVAFELDKIGKLHGAGFDEQRVSSEVADFLRSRLEHTLRPGFFERKPFFRLAAAGEKPRYTLRVSVEQVDARIFGTVRADDGVRERSYWTEDDVTNLVAFEDRMHLGARRALGSLEGLYDYVLLAGGSFLGDGRGVSARLMSLLVRQNLGTLAVYGRLRLGSATGNLSRQKASRTSLLLAGIGSGWIVFDSAPLSLESGLGLDGGLIQQGASLGAPEALDPNLLVSASVYLQLISTMARGWTLGLRLGGEQPIELPTGSSSERRLKRPQAEVSVGIGYSF